MKSRRINRRALLTAFGAVGASALLPSLFNVNGSSARAEELTPPKRLVLIGSLHGTVYDQFRLRPPGMPEDVARGTDWQMPLTGRKAATMKPGGLDPAGQAWPSGWDVENIGDFNRILAPLSPFAAKMLVLDGLSMLPTITDPLDVSCSHTKGAIGRWTGNCTREVASGVYAAQSPSLDQLVAKKIARPDRIRSLDLGAGGQWNQWPSLFDDNGNPLPTELSPVALYSRLFPTGGNPSEANPLDLAQSSVLDFVQNEYDLLAPRLSGDDRHKLEQHRDMVRDLEKRLAGLAAAQCEAASLPTIPQNGTPQEIRIVYEAFMPLVTMALSCDLTRVVGIQLPGANNPDFDAPAGDLHGDYAHHADDLPPNAFAHEMMTRYQTMNMSLVAKLCALLDSVPEGNGTMLDNTIVGWFPDMASGNHDFHNYPVVLIGGGQMLATGRYMHYAQNLTPYAGWTDFRKRVGIPHNKLLTTLGRIFGLETNFTGVESVYAAGNQLDCSGILNELLA